MTRIVGQERMAEIFGVTARTMTEWQADGMPIEVQGGPGVFGEYFSDACIQWLIKREVAKVQGPEAPKDRLARLQGDELEMKLATSRGKLIDASAPEMAMRAAIVSARERIRGEPARIAKAMHELDIDGREAALRTLFDEVLTTLSRWSERPTEEAEIDD